MKAKFITHKVNESDGAMWLKFHKGLDRKELIDLEGQETEISLPKLGNSDFEAGREQGKEEGKKEFYEAVLKVMGGGIVIPMTEEKPEEAEEFIKGALYEDRVSKERVGRKRNAETREGRHLYRIK